MKHVLTALTGLTNGMRKADAPCALRASATAEELLIEMYGPIGQTLWDDGITPQMVADALKTGQQSRVLVRLNSPGGSCFDGVAIYNLLASSGKQVRVIVDGLAASAASIVAMAGSSIEMGQGTMLMIHPAQMFMAGDSVDMREAADILEKASANMADIYATRSKQPREKVLEMMYAETWMTPQEAMDNGFADKLSENKGDAEAVAAAFDLAALYEKTPEVLQVFKAEEPKGTPLAIKKKLETLLRNLNG